MGPLDEVGVDTFSKQLIPLENCCCVLSSCGKMVRTQSVVLQSVESLSNAPLQSCIALCDVSHASFQCMLLAIPRQIHGFTGYWLVWSSFLLRHGHSLHMNMCVRTINLCTLTSSQWFSSKKHFYASFLILSPVMSWYWLNFLKTCLCVYDFAEVICREAFPKMLLIRISD